MSNESKVCPCCGGEITPANRSRYRVNLLDEHLCGEKHFVAKPGETWKEVSPDFNMKLAEFVGSTIGPLLDQFLKDVVVQGQ